jgi:hypothetical protein
MITHHPKNDFNGDGRSDILWLSDTGQTTVWLSNQAGGFGTSSTFNQSLSPTVQLLGTGDFNGDGRADEALTGTQILGSVLPITSNGSSFVTQWIDGNTQVAPGWHAIGIGDFNGDTNDDILWRSDAGLLTYWFGTPANNIGFAHNDTATVFVPIDWKVASVGDFNDDGRSDILWRQDTGQLTVWLGAANGTFIDNSANASTFVSTDWNVVGTGDFNGDGYEDILWRQTGGQLTDWLGNAAGGFTQNSANFSHFVATDWHVVSIGDFNGDHRDDILWRNDNGQLTEWLGTSTGGFTDNSANASTFVPTNWHVFDPLL